MSVPEACDDANIAAVAAELGRLLAERRLTLVTAESCTGGWIAKALTDIAGSSAWFESGLVTYSNRAKTANLGVAEFLLAEHGAVSEVVVRGMAEGARARSGASLALATSGIAGPSGGTADKPVGLVWFAWALPDGTLSARRIFAGDRESVRRQAVVWAMAELTRLLARKAAGGVAADAPARRE